MRILKYSLKSDDYIVVEFGNHDVCDGETCEVYFLGKTTYALALTETCRDLRKESLQALFAVNRWEISTSHAPRADNDPDEEWQGRLQQWSKDDFWKHCEFFTHVKFDVGFLTSLWLKPSKDHKDIAKRMYEGYLELLVHFLVRSKDTQHYLYIDHVQVFDTQKLI